MKETSRIRPVGYVKANKAGKAHIPKVIRQECATNEIPYVINASTVLLYDPTLDLNAILASIEVLKEDIKLRIDPKEARTLE